MSLLVSQRVSVREWTCVWSADTTLLNVVKICMVLKPDYQTFAMLFRSLGEMKVRVMVLHRTIHHENVTVRSNELSF